MRKVLARFLGVGHDGKGKTESSIFAKVFNYVSGLVALAYGVDINFYSNRASNWYNEWGGLNSGTNPNQNMGRRITRTSNSNTVAERVIVNRSYPFNSGGGNRYIEFLIEGVSDARGFGIGVSSSNLNSSYSDRRFYYGLGFWGDGYEFANTSFANLTGNGTQIDSNGFWGLGDRVGLNFNFGTGFVELYVNGVKKHELAFNTGLSNYYVVVQALTVNSKMSAFDALYLPAGSTLVQ